MPDKMIEIRHVTKRFGDMAANNDISFDVNKGEILALLGENGAGKSTLMNILFGLYERDEGDVIIEGRSMPLSYSPKTVIEMGMAMVHQHFKLVEAFSVSKNILLGMEGSVSKFIYNEKKANAVIGKLCSDFGMDIDPSSKVSDLSVGQRQYIEILKALYRGSKILILDEPTAVLTPQETDKLFEQLLEFKKRGMTIIIITHKLREVMAISDRVVVMRLGKVVSTLETKSTNMEELARNMIGKPLEIPALEEHAIAPDAKIIQVNGITTHAEQGKGCALKGLNLTLTPGRIVGIAGVDGNGQEELADVLSGVLRIENGSIKFGDEVVTENTTSRMQEHGVRLIPSDRHRQGLVLPLSVKDNIMLAYRDDQRFAKHGVFNSKAVDQFVQTIIEDYDVRPAKADIAVRNMSGGNQQKVILGREIEFPNISLIVASQPTRGLDVGASEFTHSQLLKLRAQDKAVLLISSDLDEIREISDEIAVMFDGKIVIQKPASMLSNDVIGVCMGGGYES